MINLLIVDDEPLVQSGIKSMIDWKSHNINIIGTAINGAVAYDIIKEHAPEIVITDIKMPVMSGLDLVKKCYEEGMTFPLFIILTSYEDFHFAKEALTYEAVDYLVKLELTSKLLEESLTRAKGKVTQIKNSSNTKDTFIGSIYLLKEQFYTRLLLNLFESDHQFQVQMHNLNLNFNYHSFAVCYVKIHSEKLADMSIEKQLNLYSGSLEMVRELTSKYMPCHVLSLDTRHFAILFFLNEAQAKEYRGTISHTIEQVSSMLFNYYSVTMLTSAGSLVSSPLQIASSFQDAKQGFSEVSLLKPILFLEDIAKDKPLKNVFNLSLFKEDIRKAYAEFNEKALYDIFTSIMELFESQPTHYVQALDAAGNILYLSLSLLANGEQIVSEIFKDKKNGYRSLYELTNVGQILEWLTLFRDGLCESFKIYNKDYKNHIVTQVKKYINEHVEKKLTLNKVAEVFNISPNYLSILFSRYNDIGFNDYMNACKIEKAKEMMGTGEYKVYEISDFLSFESAFYFSRVFKKVVGISPRDYINQSI